MATFISISGPSTTGKTSLVTELEKRSDTKNIIFSPDFHDAVWSELLESGLFSEYTEITSDSDYLCTYIIRLIDYYNRYIDSLRDSDALVILDGCWVDLSIYSMLNMWYTKIIKSVQEEILAKATKFDESISRIYVTKADDKHYPINKFRLRGKVSTFRANRPLELRYYDIAKHLKNSVPLPSSEVSESSSFIINDLKNLGYL